MNSDTQTVVYAALAAVVAAYFVRWSSHPLRSIPTVGGPSDPLLSYLGAWNFSHNGKKLISEGYQRFHGAVFKVALFDQWMVVVNGRKLVDDLRKRPDDELSFNEAIEETMHFKHTTGRGAAEDPYHIEIIREKLMRTLPVVLPDVLDELTLAVPAFIPTSETEWVTVNGYTAMLDIVARASGRVFVGLPLCRNDEYLRMAIKFTLAVNDDRDVMKYFPGPLKGLIRFTSVGIKTIREVVPFIKPLIDERKQKMEELGDGWTDKPNDMMQWILEQAIPRRSTYEEIAERLMLVNFAAIHTSSNSVTHALYHLAAVPEWIKILREEIEPIVAAEGWSKASMGKMWKLDSLFRESQRHNGIAVVSVQRKALKDITLVDGTFIPKGTMVCAASYPIHHDEAHYADAEEFDPFRFSRMREKEGEGVKHQFVNTSVDYIPFGHGRHACPGRFFAANELKALLAFLVVNYDFKFVGGGPRPENIYISENVVPDPTVQLMFRKRQLETVSSPV